MLALTLERLVLTSGLRHNASQSVPQARFRAPCRSVIAAYLLCAGPYGHSKLQVSRLSRLGPSKCPQPSLSVKLQVSPRTQSGNAEQREIPRVVLMDADSQ